MAGNPQGLSSKGLYYDYYEYHLFRPLCSIQLFGTNPNILMNFAEGPKQVHRQSGQDKAQPVDAELLQVAQRVSKNPLTAHTCASVYTYIYIYMYPAIYIYV